MEKQKLYDLIGLQPEIAEKLKEISEQFDLEKAEPCLEKMMCRETAEEAYEELEKRIGTDPDHLIMLFCQLECAGRQAENYEKMGISKAIFADTMKCFTRFLGECEKKNGRIFFDRGWWTYRQISMSLFRIGTLEYEFLKYQGKSVISVHIPSDADMTREKVDKSLEQAELFFRTYYPDYKYDKYFCESWLLASALKSCLSPQSRILSFQNRFQIMEENKEDKDFIEWIFQMPIDTKTADLPERTGLQRQVKQLMLEGGSVGAAVGLMDKPESEGVQ